MIPAFGENTYAPFRCAEKGEPNGNAKPSKLVKCDIHSIIYNNFLKTCRTRKNGCGTLGWTLMSSLKLGVSTMCNRLQQ